MTYLYIAYPSIPFDAVARKTNVSFSENLPIDNAISGERYQGCSAPTTGGSGNTESQWDLGVGEARAVNHIIVAHADKLIAQGSTSIGLQSAANGIDGTYSTVWAEASFASATLRGADSKDYIAHSLNLTANRSWLAYFTGGASTERSFSKLYFGQSWDPGVDPDSWTISRPAEESGVRQNEDGTTSMIRIADARYQFTFTWVGVEDAAANIFRNRIMKYWQEHKFFLYTTDNHRILDDKRLMHVRVADLPTISRNELASGEGYNTISANFLEVRG